ncbi:MAG: hypothetical protein EPN97_17335 [Alphaproteobacteria bacterium]|nr:MAG: hypothetical protein EPN97_17335 [Alphaproteobacteria bacterium]
MSKDISNLELPLQKVIDLGEIDRWLREILPMMPRHQTEGSTPEREMRMTGYEVTHHDFNTHTMAYGAGTLIESADIEKMVGFRRLITACSQANMRVDVSMLGHGAIEVAFNPDETFSRSRIFGASYANVLPVMFGLKNGAKK